MRSIHILILGLAFILCSAVGAYCIVLPDAHVSSIFSYGGEQFKIAKVYHHNGELVVTYKLVK